MNSKKLEDEVKEHDIKVKSERRDKLEKLSKEAFPMEEVEALTKESVWLNYESDPTWRIGISTNRKPSARIVIRPTRRFMTDEGIDFVGISSRAIKLAKQILEKPPRKEYFQGTILLDNDGCKFYEGKPLKGSF